MGEAPGSWERPPPLLPAEHDLEHGHPCADAGFREAQQGIQARAQGRIEAGGDHDHDHGDRRQAAVAGNVDRVADQHRSEDGECHAQRMEGQQRQVDSTGDRPDRRTQHAQRGRSGGFFSGPLGDHNGGDGRPQRSDLGQITREQAGEAVAQQVGHQSRQGDLGRDVQPFGSSHRSRQSCWVSNHGLGAVASERASRRA